jgi:glyoxylase-like metal-dependent hydrolase (beta-lactamase superfamily II)
MSSADVHGPVQVLDLHFQKEGTIAAFLVRTSAGPVLVETGPESLFPHLEEAVQAQGFALEDIRHVFVTHIHLDHAGSAWRMARHGAQVYVHPAGAPHLVDPAKLLKSARRIYQDDMDRLWGRLEPIEADRIVALEDGQTVHIGGVAIEAIHTPGHATHHITYRLEDGLFTGDVGGIRIGGGPVIPPFPPPDIDLAAWAESIRRMRACAPGWIYPTHFGIQDAKGHFDSLEENIHRISAWIEAGLRNGGSESSLMQPFQAFIHELLAAHGLPEAVIQDYEIADPAFMSVQGLARYWNARIGH